MKYYLGIACLTWSLWTGSNPVFAQNTPADPANSAVKKKYDPKTGEVKPPTPAEEKAEEERLKGIKLDRELRERLADTVWNDLDLQAGQAGQVWLFRPPVRKGKKDVRDWFLNDEVKLPLVGSWDVNKSEILLYALDGKLIGRGKYDDDEIVGRFIDPDHRREFGKFRLREETKRNYRVLPLRVNTRTLGK